MTIRFAQHIAPRITSVISVKRNINNQPVIVGWEFRCYTCNDSSIYMAHERPKAIARITEHTCRQIQREHTVRVKSNAR